MPKSIRHHRRLALRLTLGTGNRVLREIDQLSDALALRLLEAGVRPGDRVAVDGNPVEAKADPHRIAMLNKPVGYITSRKDEKERKTRLVSLTEQGRALVDGGIQTVAIEKGEAKPVKLSAPLRLNAQAEKAEACGV